MHITHEQQIKLCTLLQGLCCKYDLQELIEVQFGKQSCQMINELLEPEGVAQPYTQLMKQITLMSHLQSDNMSIPIASFTLLLTRSMDAQVCLLKNVIYN